jgi:hypothetical protein
MFIDQGVVNSCTPLGVLCGGRKELVLGFYTVSWEVRLVMDKYGTPTECDPCGAQYYKHRAPS